MDNGDSYIAEYDPSSEKVIVYAIQDAGEELAAKALRYIQQDAPYDQERFPEDDLEERCQKGYKTHPTTKTKKMYGKTYRNCVKAEEQK